MSLKLVKKIMTFAALASIAHFVFMTPHTLCDSLTESNGNSVELAASECTEVHELDSSHLDSDSDDHHHHCTVTVQKTIKRSTDNSLTPQLVPLFLHAPTIPTVNLRNSPNRIMADTCACFDDASRGATGQFLQSVRLLS